VTGRMKETMKTMMERDAAGLRVLYLGGTGTISASCVRLSVESGMDVSVLNRGRNSAGRRLPDGVTELSGDVTDEASLESALADARFDAVVNFLSYEEDDVARCVRVFRDRTEQYVHISSASVYGKPLLQFPVVESTPTHNRFLEYARAKLRAEAALQEAYAREGFPMTIVRPSHTYDDANPPLPGAWTLVERIARGAEIPVHGDGTSLWTLMHSSDFARAFVPLLGNLHAVGETVNVVSGDILTWDQIYLGLAAAAGVREPLLVHRSSETIASAVPAWGDVLAEDFRHSMLFDVAKLRALVPGFAPRWSYSAGARAIVAYHDADPDRRQIDAELDHAYDVLSARP
jgi:nucleoside-diphosphate-sugar epimerase